MGFDSIELAHWIPAFAGMAEISIESDPIDSDKCREVFGGWQERYGIEILGTLDDDQLQIGPTLGYPWTFYVMCDAPSHEIMIDVVDQLRRGERPLSKYIKVDMRMGRPLSDLGLP